MQVPGKAGQAGVEQGGAPTVPRPASAPAAVLARLLKSREISVVAVLVVLCAVMALTKQRYNFYGERNIHNILLQVALLSIFAIGETLVIITAGIDLSLGAMIAFAGMMVALFVTKLGVTMIAGPAVALAIVLTLVVSLAIGGAHATLIHRLRLPPFVVTLASLLVLRSQSLNVNQQLPISLADYPGLLYLANGGISASSSAWYIVDAILVSSILWVGLIRHGKVGGLLALALCVAALQYWARRTGFSLPVPIAILAAIAIVTHLLLTKARVGRYLYSIGSNEQATRLSGVNVFKVKLFAYGASALLGGLAGILWAAYGGQGDPLAGSGYELDAVAAAVVGGANLMGGEGSVIGTILGAALLQVILSSINLTLSSPDVWRGTVVGGVLLFAVLVTALQRRQTE